MKSVLHSSESKNYLPTFITFVNSTDAKEKIADFLIKEAAAANASTLLDIGAGDGTLTALLAQHFTHLTVVEKNPACIENLSLIPKVEVHHRRIEEFSPTQLFDRILFSYSFTGVAEEHQTEVLQRCLAHRTSIGKVLLVTFEDGCDWDRFSSTVYEALEIPRTGGAALHRDRVAAANLSAQTIGRATTEMWADSLDELLQVLSFFFIRKEEAYFRRIDEMRALLLPHYQTRPDGRVMLEAVEEFIEVT